MIIYNNWYDCNTDREYIYKRENYDDEFKKLQDELNNKVQNGFNTNGNSGDFDKAMSETNQKFIEQKSKLSDSYDDYEFDEDTYNTIKNTTDTVFKFSIAWSIFVIVVNLAIIAGVVFLVIYCVKKNGVKKFNTPTTTVTNYQAIAQNNLSSTNLTIQPAVIPYAPSDSETQPNDTSSSSSTSTNPPSVPQPAPAAYASSSSTPQPVLRGVAPYPPNNLNSPPIPQPYIPANLVAQPYPANLPPPPQSVNPGYVAPNTTYPPTVASYVPVNTGYPPVTTYIPANSVVAPVTTYMPTNTTSASVNPNPSQVNQPAPPSYDPSTDQEAPPSYQPVDPNNSISE